MLPLLFFIIATIYASVGFGGGTSYLALLTIFDIEYLYIPIIALICNIIVVAGNCFNYVRAGNLNIKFLTPYFLGSIPWPALVCRQRHSRAKTFHWLIQ